MDFRVERDSLGEVKVPKKALYGAQTQRAVENFPVSGTPLPRPFLRALALIKGVAAEVNRELELLNPEVADAVARAAGEVEEGRHDAHFPVDIFQTGSGTSTNMNANEVIASLASEDLGRPVHANDHVNLCQSSNDVIPTAIHLSASLEIHALLLPALDHLVDTISSRMKELEGIIKTGRTHLMDAMPISFSQELSGWQSQLQNNGERIQDGLKRLKKLALGGTAVGTGINSPQDFGKRCVEKLRQRTGIDFMEGKNRFEGLSSQDSAVEMSGHLRTLAVSLMKIANDLRWMNSGPLAGLGEISLPALQPGSSIMPGKVNPVIPESVAMVCAQVMGYDAAVAVAGQSGSFQLNVMLPLVAHNLLEMIRLLANAMNVLADKAVAGFQANRKRIQEALARNPILVTALNPVIGYEKGAAIAKKAYQEGRPVLEVALEMTDLSREDLERLLDPARLTEAGVAHTEESPRS